MEDHKPLTSLNVYLEPFFRKEILHTVVDNLSSLSDEQRNHLIEAVKNHIRISGFRNPIVAPKTLLIREMEDFFERDSRFLKVVLESWVALKNDIQPSIVSAVKLLQFNENNQTPVYSDPENAFLIGWPDDLSYEKLESVVKKQESDIRASQDEIALLTIWTTGFLPNPPSTGE